MTSPPPSSAKQSSKWGSFLQQAVAGVESRLDTILADGEEAPPTRDAPSTETNIVSKPKRPASPGAGHKPESNLSRTASSSSRQSDRLQERLARAMVQKDNGTRVEVSPAPSSSGMPSETGSPAGGQASPRSSLDAHGSSLAPLPRSSVRTSAELFRASPDLESSTSAIQSDPSGPALVADQGQMQPPRISISSTMLEGDAPTRRSIDSHSSRPSKQSTESSRDFLDPSTTLSTQNVAINGSMTHLQSLEEYESTMAQMLSDHELAEIRRQEETHNYMERIDALQTKLVYLSKETTEAARNAASSAAAGSVAKKLAEKDEQISLLMEEGQKLSKSELKHLTTIKKLRAAVKEEERVSAEGQRKLQKFENDAADSQEKLKRTEAGERRANERLKAMAKLERELETLKAEREDRNSTVSSLHSQLKQANVRASEAEKRAQTGSLEAEKKLVIELRDDLSSSRIEKELAEERARAEIREVKDQAEKAKERARVVEAELRGEQAVLESKLEVLRARMEEASTGATGDAHAKLLRQIETLQTQYAVASENWQGIESSLMSRVTILEKEKAELTRREADIRRKAREVNHKAKRVEDELESSKNKAESLEQDLLESQTQLKTVEKRLSESESALKETQSQFAQDKLEWDTVLAQRLEQERVRVREDLAFQSSALSRVESPTVSSRRPTLLQHGAAGSSSDFLSLQTKSRTRPTSSSENLPTPTGLPSEPSPKPWKGRASAHQNSRNRQDSFPSIPIPETPPSFDPDEPTSPRSPTTTTQNLVSSSAFDKLSRPPSHTTSTAPSAPSSSVALLSHLSLTIRRLESEKSSFVEDLSRTSAQLNEAKSEVGKMMREVEEKKGLEERLTQSEKEMQDVKRRYEEALVMLGEKSEEVEELRIDVADLKGIYRELVVKLGDTPGKATE